ncbi:transporter substrate-binding domain-containing protein [Rhodococcus sp. Z13]|uniref:Transporter substrate-binding domain-containing protein n=1 Tax=Rhodococcus sacchari TaxID=2962047 RepID=A0ACD4DED2_9NOCA|nr:transporter substrate-binding domain-containing protein [Rhodococcus sp. Z13]UYP18357.1 transporter substrate-binding domain-containing protein [Rhodococcus sp. Z13]
MTRFRPFAAGALAALTVLSLAACSSSDSDEDTTVAPVAANDELAALVPEEFRGATLDAVDGDSNPPMYSRDADGNITGITLDLATAAAELLGLEISVEANSFDASIPGLQSGKYDLSLWATDVTEERKQIIDQIPIGKVGYRFLGSASDEPVGDSMDQLCGKTIAAIAGQTTVPLLEVESTDCESAGKPAITVTTFPDQASAILAVKSNRADLATVNSVSGVYISDNDTELQLTGPIFNQKFTGIATAKGNGLGEAFAAAMQELVDNGTYAEIVESYGADSMLLDSVTLNPPVE